MINLEKLNNARKNKGLLSISDIAKHSGVHRNTVSTILSGKCSPYSASFLKISEVLEIDPKELILNSANASYKDQIIDTIKNNLHSHLDIAFFLFGSRVGTKDNSSNKTKIARKFSDFDIGISGGKNKINANRFLELKEEFSTLFEDFPVCIDLVNFDDAPDWFLFELQQKPEFLCGDFNIFNYTIGYLDARKEQTRK